MGVSFRIFSALFASDGSFRTLYPPPLLAADSSDNYKPVEKKSHHIFCLKVWDLNMRLNGSAAVSAETTDARNRNVEGRRLEDVL